MKKNLTFLLLLILLCFQSLHTFSNTFTVTNTNDSGAGSLREAINNANMNGGADIIAFNIPLTDAGYDAASGVWTIAPDSTLPYLWGGQTLIDGTSQTMNQGNTNFFGPETAIDGRNMLDYGFAIVSAMNEIKGFIIGQCNYGIEIASVTALQNNVSENFIGVNYNGTSAFPNNYGILSGAGASNNNIFNNIISGNISEGIMIYQSDFNHVYNNKIGTDASGILPVPNSNGMLLNECTNNTIGGSNAGDRNTISGNTNAGIILNGTGTENNFIRGNFIGSDASGMMALSNYTGIILKSQANKNVIGGSAANERNIISGNTEIGVYIESSDSNRISANYIGPDVTGNAAFKNGDSLVQANGIEVNTTSRFNVTGGNTAGERNIISGNRIYGFVYYGNVSYNPLTGNYIGTNAAGTVSLPNATGICVDGGSNHNIISKNVLSGNKSYGIFIVTHGTYFNELKGNLIGTNAAGTDTVPNDIGLVIAGGARFNLIGGSTAADRNIISGNHYDGVEIADQFTDSNTIAGNYIGTDITGMLRLGNAVGIGFSTNPKHNLVDNNVISGNRLMGIVIFEHADSNKFINNKIGTAANGASDLGNGSAGIAIAYGPKWNLIGEPGAGNIIAFNDSSGIVIAGYDTKYNRISANSVWGNFGSGIEIFPPMVNTNDAGDNDTGPNDLMNFPVITSSEYHSNGDFTVVNGTLDTHNPELCAVEIFSAVSNFFNYGDGKTYLGFAIPDVSGNWCDTVTGAANGMSVTSTATDELMNTSEFSANKITTLYAGTTDDYSKDIFLNVYPNPCNDELFAEYENGNALTDLYNINGKIIQLPKPGITGNGTNKAKLDISRIPSGIYFLKAVNDKGCVVKKIVKMD